jgi:uncharacterized tellurite resistance protein B-like protein
MQNIFSHIYSSLGRGERTEAQRESLEDAQLVSTLNDSDTISVPVACAYLLTGIAMADGHFDSSEYDYLYRRLSKGLGMRTEEIRAVVEQARMMLGAGRSAASFADQIRERCSLEERRKIYDIVKGMASADGTVDAFELFLQKGFAVQLGVEA